MANSRWIRPAAMWLSFGILLLVSLFPLFAHAVDASQPPFEGLSPAHRPGPGASIPGISPAALASLRLAGEQRAKVVEIERDIQRTQWRLMGSIREARWKQQDALRAPEIDAMAVLARYDEIATLRRQYFEAAIAARKRLEAALTAEQRRELSRWVEPVRPGNGVSEERASPR